MVCRGVAGGQGAGGLRTQRVRRVHKSSSTSSQDSLNTRAQLHPQAPPGPHAGGPAPHGGGAKKGGGLKTSLGRIFSKKEKGRKEGTAVGGDGRGAAKGSTGSRRHPVTRE